MEALEKVGVSKRVRTQRMKNAAMQQLAALMYAYSCFVTGASDLVQTKESICKLQRRMAEHKDYYLTNNAVTAAFSFMEKLFQLLEG